MNYDPLSKALRTHSAILTNIDGDDEDYTRTTAELINCLARMVEGKDVYDAFGAPGDWGYSTPIGKALQAAYSAQ